MNPTRKQDPICALENRDEVHRRQFLKAARFVVRGLSGEELRNFMSQATTLLRTFAPNHQEPNSDARGDVQ